MKALRLTVSDRLKREIEKKADQLGVAQADVVRLALIAYLTLPQQDPKERKSCGD